MSAAYWVRVSDELLAGLDPSYLPDGLRLADLGIRLRSEPGSSEVLFEDDNAPPELDGKRVELILRREGSQTVIAERRVLE